MLGEADHAGSNDAAGFWRSMVTFYALAVGITWVAWAPLYLGKAGLGWLPLTAPLPWVVPGTLGPAIAATLVRRRDGRGPTFAQLVRPSPGAVGATAVALCGLALTFVVGTAAILTRRPPLGWRVGAVSLYGFHVLTTLIGGPIFEEWGWRGFAQARLQRRTGPLGAALLVGPAWALWHLPLFLVPTWSSASPPAYVLMVTGLSVVMAWGFNAASGWIVTAILMHAVYNGSSRVLGAFLGDAQLRAWPDPVTAIMLAFAAAALFLVVATRGRLGLRTSGR